MLQEEQIITGSVRKRVVGGVGAVLLGVFVFAVPCFGQTKLENLCRETRNAFVGGEWKGKVLRDDVFASDCTIEVSLSGERRLHVSIDQYGSVKETRRELKKDLSLFFLADKIWHSPPRRRIKIELDRWWTYGTAYRQIDSMLLLQRDVFYILVITSNQDDLVPIVQALKKVGVDVGI